jgi:hypothetical protein
MSLTKVQIRDEIVMLERTFNALMSVLAQVDTILEIALFPALLAHIKDFSTGCERISTFHKQRLRQVADQGSKDRPPLWQGSLLLELDEYRKFRHLDRHRYKLELQLSRVLELAHQVQQSYPKIQQDLAQFSRWLEQQAS